jgi:pre-mRNA-splicing factor SYF2
MDNIYYRQGHHHLKNDEVVRLHMFQSRLDIQSSSFNPHTQHQPTTAIMSSTLKRKPSPSEDESLVESSKRRFTETTTEETAPSQDNDTTSSAAPTPTSGTDSTTTTSQTDRLARFAALRNRNKSSRDDNRKATTLEVSRASADPGALASLSRRKERATEKLLHAQTLEDGDDWDRKRAWDWTAEESAAWDKKQAKKKAHRDNVAFQDFSQDANKIYKRQVREMNPDVSNYEAEKMAAVERAARSGGLEIVETEDGELIAVDKDGSFYSTKDSTDFVGNKPTKEKIDKLVGEIQKAEEVRLKKRKERSGKEEDGDVTYINDKNKQVSCTASKGSLWKSMLTLCDNSSTKNWRGSTTSILRRSGIVSRGVLLFERICCCSRYLASTLFLHFFSVEHRRQRSTKKYTCPV